jgi:DNA polymerase
MTIPDRRNAAAALLRWYVDMGVDEAVAAAPAAATRPAGGAAPARAPRPAAPAAIRRVAPARPAAMSADEAVRAAEAAAAGCATLDELAAAVRAFDGCPLKAGARSTVFCDGAASADLLVIGEAPGRDEDATGKPFVGRAGKLLDCMLAAIGRSRARDALITNVVYWRPPGNRTPTQAEIAACRPFVDRLIEIVKPKAIALAGGTPMQALTGLTSIMRSRGTWRTIETAGGAQVAAIATYHPAFLLRQPAQKRFAWADLLALQKRLTDG